MTVKLKLTMLHVLRKNGNVNYSLNHIFQKLSLLLYCSKEYETYGSFFKSYITCTMFKYVFAYVFTSYNHMNVSVLLCLPPLGETYCFCLVRLSVCPSVTLRFRSIT